jgi:hypothetical protein
MSRGAFGEAERLDESVLRLSSLLAASKLALILVGFAPLPAWACNCRMEGVGAMGGEQSDVEDPQPGQSEVLCVRKGGSLSRREGLNGDGYVATEI